MKNNMFNVDFNKVKSNEIDKLLYSCFLYQAWTKGIYEKILKEFPWLLKPTQEQFEKIKSLMIESRKFDE